MAETKVSIVRLNDYRPEKKVYTAVKKSLDLLGGLENIFKPGLRVFVKINHLSPSSSPDRGIITHPFFAREVLRLLKELGMDITVGDDIHSNEKDGFSLSGYRQVCEELGIRLVNLKEKGFKEVACHGKILNKVYISPLVIEADHILNLPKLKTHSFTALTGAVKNMFGVIPHGLRLKCHRNFPKNEIFSQALVDIFSCIPPHLTVMDAVVAMGGEGPSAGSLRNPGIVMASRDAVALDAVASKIIGFDPRDILTTCFAHEQGFGEGRISEIEILGEPVRNVEVRDFKHSALALGFLRRKIPSFLHAYVQDQLAWIPEVFPARCTACLECVTICPRRAVILREDKAWIDESLCIHCLCCHEVCLEGAIKLKQKPVGLAVRKAAAFYKRLKSLVSS